MKTIAQIHQALVVALVYASAIVGCLALIGLVFAPVPTIITAVVFIPVLVGISMVAEFFDALLA
jgi:hypothetical protein